MTNETAQNIAKQVFDGKLPWDYTSTLATSEAVLVGQYLAGLEHCDFDQKTKRSEQ